MSEIGAFFTNYDSQGLIDNSRDSGLPSPPIFILCDSCYWCATYFNKTRTPMDNICPHCGADESELTNFPIMSNESFIFDYSEKRGVQLEFKARCKYPNGFSYSF